LIEEDGDPNNDTDGDEADSGVTNRIESANEDQAEVDVDFELEGE
jgi:hypothetical protein